MHPEKSPGGHSGRARGGLPGHVMPVRSTDPVRSLPGPETASASPCSTVILLPVDRSPSYSVRKEEKTHCSNWAGGDRFSTARAI